MSERGTVRQDGSERGREGPRLLWLRDHVDGLRGAEYGERRWGRPDLQSITLRACPNSKNGMEIWGLGCGSGKMDELIALYLSS